MLLHSLCERFVRSILILAVLLGVSLLASTFVSPVAYAQESEPVVFLAVNGSDEGTVSKNDDSVLLEWHVSGVSNCEITPEPGSIPVEPSTGSATVEPPTDTETEYVLTCDGVSDSVDVLLAPTATSSLEPDTTSINLADGSLDESVTFTWSSDNADYCTDFRVTRDYDGATELFGAADGVGDANGTYTFSPTRSGLLNEGLGEEFTIETTCLNQFSGETITTASQLTIEDGEYGELAIDFTRVDSQYVPRAGYDYRNTGFFKAYPRNATECGPREITSPNRTYNEPQNFRAYGWTKYGDLFDGLLFSGLTLTEDAELSLTCWQEDSDGNRVAEITESVTFNFEPRLEDDGSLHDPYSVDTEAVLETRVDGTDVRTVSKDPLTGNARVELELMGINANTCGHVYGSTPGGYTSSTNNPNSKTGFDRYINLATTTEYTFTASCERIPEFPDACDQASVESCGAFDPVVLTADASTDIRVTPDGDPLEDPSVAITQWERLTTDEGDDGEETGSSEYEVAWESSNVLTCEFAAETADGDAVTLNTLQSVDSTNGTTTQSFTNSGTTITLTVSCSRSADDVIATDEVTFTLPGSTTGETTTVTDSATVATGECLLDGSVVAVPPGYYEELTESEELEPCQRYLPPDLRVTQIDAPDLSLPLDDALVSWEYDTESLTFTDVPLSVTYTNVSEDAHVFSDESALYDLMLDEDEVTPAAFESNSTLLNDTFSEGFTPGQSETITLNLDVPVGEHLLRGRIENDAGLNGDTTPTYHARFQSLDAPLPNPDLSLSLERSVTRADEPVTVYWSAQTAFAAECSITGPGVGDAITFSLTDGEEESGEEEITPRNSGLITLTCVDQVTGNNNTFTEEERITLVAPFIES